MEALDLLVGEPSVVLDLGDVEVDAAVGGDVAEAVGYDLLDHVDDVADALARLGIAGRAVHAELGDVLEVPVDVSPGEIQGVDALLRGAGDDLVIHVGEIGDVLDLIALVAEVARNGVEDDYAAGVAHVDIVVDGDTAHVHPDLAGLNGSEFLHRIGESVVDTKYHLIDRRYPLTTKRKRSRLSEPAMTQTSHCKIIRPAFL